MVRPNHLFLIVACSASVIWAYWTTLVDTVERWTADPQYSHGYLVPIFAIYLLWHRKQLYSIPENGKVGWLWLGLLVLGFSVRTSSVILFQSWLDGVSLILCVGAVFAAVGGWPAIKWSWPAITFLIFMIPLPYRVQGALGSTLQKIATDASTYALQTTGIPAVAEGNIILLTEARIGVVEACSGLGMMMTFVALATGVALLVKRSWLEKGLIVASAIPVAVIANVVRITVTGMLNEASQDRLARIVFHDVAGWLMMPLALLILFLELHVLSRLLVSPDKLGRRLNYA